MSTGVSSLETNVLPPWGPQLQLPLYRLYSAVGVLS